MTCMEKRCFIVWNHPDRGICRLSWRLSKESPGVEDRIHRKIRVLRGGIKVLEGFPNGLNDMQPLRTFFLDFSDEGLFGRLTSFYPSSGEPEVSMLLDGRNPAGAVSYHSIDGSSSVICVSAYLRTEDVLHISHDG